MLAADRLNCSPFQLLPSDHPLADPQAWIGFAVMVKRVENKARAHNAEGTRDKVEAAVKQKGGHKGKLKEK